VDLATWEQIERRRNPLRIRDIAMDIAGDDAGVWSTCGQQKSVFSPRNAGKKALMAALATKPIVDDRI